MQTNSIVRYRLWVTHFPSVTEGIPFLRFFFPLWNWVKKQRRHTETPGIVLEHSRKCTCYIQTDPNVTLQESELFRNLQKQNVLKWKNIHLVKQNSSPTFQTTLHTWQYQGEDAVETAIEFFHNNVDCKLFITTLKESTQMNHVVEVDKCRNVFILDMVKRKEMEDKIRSLFCADHCSNIYSPFRPRPKGPPSQVVVFWRNTRNWKN